MIIFIKWVGNQTVCYADVWISFSCFLTPWQHCCRLLTLSVSLLLDFLLAQFALDESVTWRCDDPGLQFWCEEVQLPELTTREGCCTREAVTWYRSLFITSTSLSLCISLSLFVYRYIHRISQQHIITSVSHDGIIAVINWDSTPGWSLCVCVF